MNFIEILYATYSKGETEQDITINELLEDLKVKLNGLREQNKYKT